MGQTIVNLEDYINQMVTELNLENPGHEYVCIEFNRAKQMGKALCIKHKTSFYREYMPL